MLLIYVQLPKQNKVLELLNAAPLSLLTTDALTIKWLDELKREAAKTNN